MIKKCQIYIYVYVVYGDGARRKNGRDGWGRWGEETVGKKRY